MIDDYKYRIPEMDRLLAAAADTGIRFSNYYEETDNNNGKGGVFVAQVATMKKKDVFIMLTVTKTNPKSNIPPSGRKPLIDTSKKYYKKEEEEC